MPEAWNFYLRMSHFRTLKHVPLKDSQGCDTGINSAWAHSLLEVSRGKCGRVSMLSSAVLFSQSHSMSTNLATPAWVQNVNFIRSCRPMCWRPCLLLSFSKYLQCCWYFLWLFFSWFIWLLGIILLQIFLGIAEAFCYFCIGLRTNL